MVITAVFEVTTCAEIEVPDGTDKATAEALALEYLDENYFEIAENIDDQNIDVKEVWL